MRINVIALYGMAARLVARHHKKHTVSKLPVLWIYGLKMSACFTVTSHGADIYPLTEWRASSAGRPET